MSTTSEVSTFSDHDYSSQDESDAEDAEWELRTRRHKPFGETNQTLNNECRLTLPALGVQTILVTITVQKSLRNELGGDWNDGEGPRAEVQVAGCLISHEISNKDNEKKINFDFIWNSDPGAIDFLTPLAADAQALVPLLGLPLTLKDTKLTGEKKFMARDTER